MPKVKPIFVDIAGDRYEGWKSVNWKVSLDSPAIQIMLTANSNQLPMQTDAQLFYGPEQIAAGYISSWEFDDAIDEKMTEYSIQSTISDFLDSTPNTTKRQWHNATGAYILTDLLKAYGIPLVDEAHSKEKFPAFTLEVDETGRSILKRITRMHGLLAVPTATGQIKLIKQANAGFGATLTYGEQLKSLRGKRDWSERFSSYKVFAQQSPDDDSFGEVTVGISSVEQDVNVIRHRPLRIVADSWLNKTNLKNRAIWEAKMRQAQALTLTGVVEGWSDADSSVWKLGTIHRVAHPARDIDANLMISSIEGDYSKESGTTAILEFSLPEAYSAEPIVPEPAGGIW